MRNLDLSLLQRFIYFSELDVLWYPAVTHSLLYTARCSDAKVSSSEHVYFLLFGF